ncbi:MULTISPECIES: LacI family DNA-binding transcriptional regulator [Nesterenkonia]|uniref:LacI family DNA-binding transcriptional regulator n=1 Tax=Nesterenkonia flava TaxID=469799 RepID=A0ABU1FW04_9MICC|nr:MULTISPECIES: LacI family DNA-binding transcriptional regulator [Nesterenkonia]MDR5712864.1 LacI family DNA-binding transcriptional regulator [Nesterenkonia flava]
MSPTVPADGAEGRRTSRRSVTIRDVAAHAGVSAGTVSNVLNRPYYVKEETRERVLRAIDELDFHPTQNARQFRPGRERTLGIAVANLDNPFFVDVALGAEELARQHDIGVVITNSAYDPEVENQNLDLLVQHRVQGLIISPVDESSSRLQMLHDRGVPMVFVDRVGRNATQGWSVIVDDERGGAMAAQHLMNTGHRSIALVGHPHTSPKVRARLEGMQSAVAKHGGVRLEVLETDSWTVDTGRYAGTRLAEMSPQERPTGILCANDLLALGVLQSLSRHGLRVPEDVAVIGYDDLAWAEVSAPALTTIRQPRKLMGATAVRMLLELFKDVSSRPRHNHVVLQPELVVRDSA